jgi:hypothetical protein
MAISSSKEFIVFPNDNSGRVFVKEQAFTASGTWTAPAGVTSAQVILVGAGGGGGGGSQNVAGGGGAGGAVVVRNIDVTPLTTYAVSIGAGGQGGLGAQNAAADVTSTLPGGNGTPTTFGTITVANLLTNTDFDYNVLGWDGDVYFKSATGISGQSSITVFPNANGITVGQYVVGSGVVGNATVVSITGNVVSLSGANTATVSNIVRFDAGNTILRPATAFFYNISSAGSDVLSNPQTNNTAGSPYFTNLSNNLLQPNLAQMEDALVVTNNLIRQYGTALATFNITNAGVPAKLAEMTGGYAKTATAPLTSLTVTLNNTLNVFPGMFITGGAFVTGTVVTSVDSSTQITISNATTQVLNNTAVEISYTGARGINGLICGTSSSTASGNPTWINFSSLNATSTSNGLTTVAGTQGIPYIPGQTYTLSMYISTNVDVGSSTPIRFGIRSTGASWNAASNARYSTSGTTSGDTGSIDAGQANGFFYREATPTTLTGFGGTFGTTATASSGSTTITVADASGILQGMSVTGSGIQASTTVSAIAGTLVTLTLATNAPISGGAVTFANPGTVQMLGSNSTPTQTGWRRLSATFTTPTIASTLANGQYAWGSTPQFIYPSVLLQQGSTNYWIDNIQLEAGNATTTWRPPTYREAASLLVSSNQATNGNLETAHRFVKASPGVQYSGSAFLVDTGTANNYRPVRAYLEFFDRDYNSIIRTEGSNVYLPISGAASLTQQMPAVTYPVRVGATVTAPVNTAFVKFGITKIAASTTATLGQIEYHVIAPQLEVAAVPTTYKEVDNVTYFYAGQPGITPIVTAATLSAEGGGGGGTWNSNNPVWLYGLEGANNGGHAANNSSGAMTLAGGGGGSMTAGGNALTFTPAFSTAPSGGWATTAGSSQPTWPMRGNFGGAASWNSGTGNTNIPGWGGDGGQGQLISSINSSSPLGIPLGGGGGGAGWTTGSQNQTSPGRGQGGGGKGGGTWIVNASGASADYYARGLDAIQNTGGGGGGGGSNWGNDPFAPLTHNSGQAAVNYEAISSDYFKWTPVYNANIVISAQGGFYGSNVLRTTIQDVGNAKVTTVWQTFPILTRIPLFFTGVAARLTTAPAGVTSPQFSGTPKRVRPTVRWKNDRNVVIREDRPEFNIQFAGVNTITYLGAAGATSGNWQTLAAPADAAFFDVCWELLYMDAGDVVDLDLGGLQYYGYQSFGGNGADGYALVRWFDKAVL